MSDAGGCNGLQRFMAKMCFCKIWAERILQSYVLLAPGSHASKLGVQHVPQDKFST